MTEDEARTKWCPMVRQGLIFEPGGASFNRKFTMNAEPSQVDAYCIASACMMWRTGPKGGYCGLAGDE